MDFKHYDSETLKKFTGVENSTVNIDTRFAGTRANPSIRGSISNLSTDNFTPENLTFGVLKGMLDEIKNMYLSMNETRTGIVGSGNGLRINRHLLKLAEKEFGSNIKTPVHLEEAAVGAALFSGVSSGVFKNSQDAQKTIKYK